MANRIAVTIAIMCGVLTLAAIYDGYPLLVLPGLTAGLLVWSRIVHLSFALTGLTSTIRPSVEVPVAVLGRYVAALLVFGGVWLAVFSGIAAYFYLHQQSRGWPWFFVGIAATPCLVLPNALIVWRRIRDRALVSHGTGQS
jgi:hypothetical protein